MLFDILLFEYFAKKENFTLVSNYLSITKIIKFLEKLTKELVESNMIIEPESDYYSFNLFEEFTFINEVLVLIVFI